MVTIILRNIPEDLMRGYSTEAAESEGAPLPAEVLYLTEIGVRRTLQLRRDHADAVKSMRRRLADMPRFRSAQRN